MLKFIDDNPFLPCVLTILCKIELTPVYLCDNM